MDELIAKLQRKFEADLEYFLPEYTTPYFDRRQLVAGLLCAAHVYGLEVCQKIMEGYHKLQAPTVIAIDKSECNCLPGGPSCPNCGARVNG